MQLYMDTSPILSGSELFVEFRCDGPLCSWSRISYTQEKKKKKKKISAASTVVNINNSRDKNMDNHYGIYQLSVTAFYKLLYFFYIHKINRIYIIILIYVNFINKFLYVGCKGGFSVLNCLQRNALWRRRREHPEGQSRRGRREDSMLIDNTYDDEMMMMMGMTERERE